MGLAPGSERSNCRAFAHGQLRRRAGLLNNVRSRSAVILKAPQERRQLLEHVRLGGAVRLPLVCVAWRSHDP